MATNKKPRVNKKKEELVADIEKTQRIERMKVLARLIWPFLEPQKSIYDAQTVLNATAGFLKNEFNKKADLIIVKDLPVDLSKEDEGEIKTAIEHLLQLLQTEKAEDTIALLERMGNSFGQFAALEYLKNPMSAINRDEFIA